MPEEQAQAQEGAQSEAEEVEGNGASPAGDGGGSPLRERLGSAGASLKRKEVLIPIAVSAASAAVAYTVRNGPRMAKGAVDKVKEKGSNAADAAVDKAAGKAADKGTEKMKEALSGGSGGVVGAVTGLASKVLGGGGKDKGKGAKKTRRLPIQRWTDIAAPVDVVYEHWTNYEEYPKFMHRVLSVQQPEDNKVTWNEKIWFSKRQWDAEITDDRPNERVAWKTVGGQVKHNGVVTFHRLDDNLTRVLATIDFQPTGLFEKMASGLRFVKRATQSDLARFKAYVEMEVEGEDENGYQQVQDERQEDEEPEAREQQEESGDDTESQDAQPQAEEEQTPGDDTAEREQPSAEGEDDETATAEGDDDESDREAERREREARRAQRRERISA